LREEGETLARQLVARTAGADAMPACELLVCPPATLLCLVGGILAGSGIGLGGQDCHAAAKGAYTGDISAEMLADLGCRYVILGHSERRHGHGETDAEIRDKLAAARRAGVTAILCAGQTQQHREAGDADDIVSS